MRKPHLKLFQPTNPDWRRGKILGVSDEPKRTNVSEHYLWSKAYEFAWMYNHKIAVTLEQPATP